MRFLNGWSTADKRTLVNFDDKVLAVFEHHIHRGVGDSEAGGLLLGEVRGEHLNILEATVPTAFDRRMRYFFERLPFGHATIAENLWRKSKGTVRYLGEWHTHPQDIPSPSAIDRLEWSRLVSERKDKRPFLAVIVGRDGLWVELVAQKATGTVLNTCI